MHPIVSTAQMSKQTLKSEMTFSEPGGKRDGIGNPGLSPLWAEAIGGEGQPNPSVLTTTQALGDRLAQ